MTVASGQGQREREYRFEVVRSKLLAPSLVGLVSYSSVVASDKALGESTLDIRTRVKIDEERTVESEVAVASGMPPAAVTEQIGWPIETLMENPFEDIEIEDIHVDVRVVDRIQLATIDGLRAEFERGWGLVRASNTVPCLVLRFEADDELALSTIQDEFRRVLLQVDPGLSLPF